MDFILYFKHLYKNFFFQDSTQTYITGYYQDIYSLRFIENSIIIGKQSMIEKYFDDCILVENNFLSNNNERCIFDQ